VVPHRKLNHPWLNNGVHVYGTINWLALDKSTHIEQFVIVSLDLSTETYKQFLLPLGFDEVPFSQPLLRALMDCLYFSHCSNKTEFILWKMKEYGVQESWTQLFKISYQNLAKQIVVSMGFMGLGFNIDYGYYYQLVCLYVNGDIVIFVSNFCKQSFIYNLKDNTVVKIKSINTIHWFHDSKDYVESLVSVH
jgi:F-box interacting protein